MPLKLTERSLFSLSWYQVFKQRFSSVWWQIDHDSEMRNLCRYEKCLKKCRLELDYNIIHDKFRMQLTFMTCHKYIHRESLLNASGYLIVQMLETSAATSLRSWVQDLFEPGFSHAFLISPTSFISNSAVRIQEITNMYSEGQTRQKLVKELIAVFFKMWMRKADQTVERIYIIL